MSTLDDLLLARSGPMTSELVQHPGDFGLGNVPSRLAPAGTAKAICGFCSTDSDRRGTGYSRRARG